jgi:hypothetical protein
MDFWQTALNFSIPKVYNARVHWCCPFSTSCQCVTRKSAIHWSFHIIGVAWRIKIHHSNTPVERRIKIVQLEQVFEPYRMLFKEMKEGKKERSSSHQWFCKENKNEIKKKHCFFGGGGRRQFADFPISRGVFARNPRAKRETSLLWSSRCSETQIYSPDIAQPSGHMRVGWYK